MFRILSFSLLFFTYQLHIARAETTFTEPQAEASEYDLQQDQFKRLNNKELNAFEFLAYWDSDKIVTRSDIPQLTKETPLESTGGGHTWGSIAMSDVFHSIDSTVKTDFCLAIQMGESFLSSNPKMLNGNVNHEGAGSNRLGPSDYSLKGVPFLGIAYREGFQVKCFLPQTPGNLEIFNRRFDNEYNHMARECRVLCNKPMF